MKCPTIRLALASALLASCNFELVSPDPGTCDDDVAPNRWPWFVEGPAVVLDTGFSEGQVPPDYRLFDQFGEPTCLWQLAGKVVVVDASALWCGPCRAIAEHVACVQESYGDDLVYVTLITENRSYAPAEQADVQSWSDEYGLGAGTQTPVLLDGTEVAASPAWVPSLPAFLVLDRDLTIQYVGAGVEGDRLVREKLTELLGEPTKSCEE